MNREEEVLFEEFLSSQMKEKNMSVKRLSEMTGIAPVHLENILHGNFDNMPSAPYFRGYIIRVGQALGFDGEVWWNRIRNTGEIKLSGPSDALPENRFEKKVVPKWVWAAGAILLLALIYFGITLPRITGTPSLIVTFPGANPYTTNSTTLTFQGTVKNADALYLNGEQILIGADGSWQKTVLLSQSDPNVFAFTAKKFLGSEKTVTEQVLFQPAPGTSGTASSTSSTPQNPATPF